MCPHATPRVPIVRRWSTDVCKCPFHRLCAPNANELSFISKHTKTEGMHYVQLEPKGCTGATASTELW